MFITSCMRTSEFGVYQTNLMKQGGGSLVDFHDDHLRPAVSLPRISTGILGLALNQNHTFFWGTIIQLQPIGKTGLWRGRTSTGRVWKRKQDLPVRLKRQGAHAEFLLPGNQHDLWKMTLTNITLVQSRSTPQGVLCSSCKVCKTEASPYDTEGVGMLS